LVHLQDPSLSLLSLSNGSLEILPSNQWPLHPSWTNENREWFFSPMEIRMRILMPNETRGRFHSPIK
jgi:hypothetical protein